MGDFKRFLENRDVSDDKDVKATIQRLPKSHRELLKGYEFKFQDGNTLDGDHDHVGSNDLKNKVMVIASSFLYSRCFVLLHEIGHVVWKSLPEEKQDHWNKLAKDLSKKIKQGLEETFCMVYANVFCNKPLVVFNNEKLEQFIKQLN